MDNSNSMPLPVTYECPKETSVWEKLCENYNSEERKRLRARMSMNDYSNPSHYIRVEKPETPSLTPGAPSGQTIPSNPTSSTNSYNPNDEFITFNQMQENLLKKRTGNQSNCGNISFPNSNNGQYDTRGAYESHIPENYITVPGLRNGGIGNQSNCENGGLPPMSQPSYPNMMGQINPTIINPTMTGNGGHGYFGNGGGMPQGVQTYHTNMMTGNGGQGNFGNGGMNQPYYTNMAVNRNQGSSWNGGIPQMGQTNLNMTVNNGGYGGTQTMGQPYPTNMTQLYPTNMTQPYPTNMTGNRYGNMMGGGPFQGNQTVTHGFPHQGQGNGQPTNPYYNNATWSNNGPYYQ